MPDLKQQIGEARGRGYSDDEILGHLGTTRQELAPKIQQAREAGYAAGDILGHLSTATPKTAAEKFGVTNPIGKGALDVIEGVGAGVMSTIRGASQIAHKVIPAIPEIPAEYAEAPDSLAGKAGKFAEQAAEFVLPGMAATKLTKGAGLAARAGAQAAAAGVTSAVQTGGDPGATAAGAAAGAAGPVLGAAVKSGAAALGKTRLPQKLYQSAVKPTWAMAKKDGLTMLDTGLKEQIPVSAKGLEMVEQRIAGLRNEINDGIVKHAGQGRTVDTSKVLDSLDDLEAFYKNTAAPEDALATLKEIRLQFEQYHGKNIPVDVAQQIKINTYQELKKSYGQMASAKVEGLKQVARGLKEQISAVFPEISALNEQQSKLIGLDEALTRAVWRIENHQMMGIGSPLAAAGGHAILGGPGAIAAFAGKFLLDNPTLKSKLAIALTKAGAGNQATMPKITARLASLKAVLEAAASKAAEGRTQSTGELIPGAAQ
jgi:hypothetical protein